MSKRDQNCDIFNEVTNSIIELIESGVKPFQKPWNDQAYNGLPMRHNGEFYKGVNPFILSLTSFVKGYKSGYWMTFKQAKEFKAQVRKGEKGTKIFKSGKTSKMVEMEEIETGETKEVKQTFKYLKAYTVFNADQIEGLPEKFYFELKDGVKPNPDETRPDLDSFFMAQGIEIKHGGNKAYYSITNDYIQMPEFKAFKQACGYYSTLAHEFVHNAALRIMPCLGCRGLV